jgi:hypothetical protein
VLHLSRCIVGVTVDFDRETRGGAIEVEDVRSNRVLSAKAQSRELALPQGLPQNDFRQAHFLPQFARSFESPDRRAHAPSTMLRMVPLPRVAGEEPETCLAAESHAKPFKFAA